MFFWVVKWMWPVHVGDHWARKTVQKGSLWNIQVPFYKAASLHTAPILQYCWHTKCTCPLSPPLLISVASPGSCGVVMYLKSQLRMYFDTIFLRTCHLWLKICRNSVCFGCNFRNNLLFSCKHPLYPEKGRKNLKRFKCLKGKWCV